MTWENRKGQKYYYRRRRVEGRVVAEYFGQGPIAEMAAMADEMERDQAGLQAERWKQLRESDKALDQEVRAGLDQLQQLTAVLLEEEGFHQPKGTWRRKR